MEKSTELPLFQVVGFSGHRQLRDPVAAARVMREALDSLRNEAPGEWIALSSIASGSDQLFVAQARAAGLAWHAMLPMPRNEFARDFDPTEWVDVEKTLATAEQSRIIDEAGTREDAYLDCGMETVNGADVLLVLWDGEPARGKGGTADVVEYAMSVGKPLMIVDANSLEIRRENWSRLKRHDATLTSLNALSAARTAWATNPFSAPESISSFQQKCDYAATRGAPQSRRLIVSMLLLHVLATIIAAAALAYDLHLQLLPWAKLFCLAAAVGVAFILRHRTHSQHNWVRCRLAAEFCRSALATWGLPRAIKLLQDVDLPSMRGLTRTLQVLHGRASASRSVSIDEFKRIYVAERIDDQLAYFTRQEDRASPLFIRFRAGFWVATLLALASTASYAIAYSLHVDVPHWMQTTVFYFLPITLPVVAASLISLISINDLQRRVARYREMRVELEASRRQIGFCATWNSIERVVLKTERALLHEVLEWHSITSFAESH